MLVYDLNLLYVVEKWVFYLLLFLISIFILNIILLNKCLFTKTYPKHKTIYKVNNLQPNYLIKNRNHTYKNIRFYSTSKPNNKTIKERFITGLKVGWNTPLLPEKVIVFQNHPLVRIFRVTGGISIVTVLANKHLLLFLPLKLIVLLLALLHFIYLSVISMIKLWHGFKVLKSDKLNIKNSPFDHFATVTGKLLYCWKFGCQVGSTGLGLVGTSFMIDSMLEAGNHEKVFTPIIGKGVKFMVGGTPADNILSEMNKNMKQIEDSKKRLEEIKKLFDKTDNVMKSSDFDKKDIDSIKSVMHEIKNMEKSKLQQHTNELAKKIREYSNDNK